ncbi:hypothetical protein Acr_04g0009600 [Actinidia rufa]|uniref:Uncharacterized protein n=1 Tax=Actinidia rufa TaxID=165716 RepID=A0A7J0EIW0_9ERIC|nr:hypothetical protein Acr_04g0009600 [Actinidia rufa]
MGSTSKYPCTTPGTLKLTKKPCPSGSLIAFCPNMAFRSPATWTKRGSSPWVLFSGLTREMVFLVRSSVRTHRKLDDCFDSIPWLL